MQPKEERPIRGDPTSGDWKLWREAACSGWILFYKRKGLHDDVKGKRNLFARIRLKLEVNRFGGKKQTTPPKKGLGGNRGGQRFVCLQEDHERRSAKAAFFLQLVALSSAGERKTKNWGGTTESRQNMSCGNFLIKGVRLP